MSPEGVPWTLTIPPFSAGSSGGKKPLGVLYQSPPQRLIAQNSPTIMEEWELQAIWLPVAVFLEWSEVPGAAGAAAVTATLRRGGDIIWTKEEEAATRTVSGSGELIQAAQVVLADNFINPLILRRGQDLTLGLSIMWVAGAKEVTRVEAIASQVANLASVGATTRQEGNVQYLARRLSGHREL